MNAFTPINSNRQLDNLKFHSEIGEVTFIPFKVPQHADIIYEWVTDSRARFWGLQNATREQVVQEYQRLTQQQHQWVLLGCVNKQPAFILEIYDPQYSELKHKIPLQPNDLGLHLLIAPCENPIRHFSYWVMHACMRLLFEQFEARRIVVEPDHRNHKIHALNRRVGFQHHEKVALSNKIALWGSCNQQQFQLAHQLFLQHNPNRNRLNETTSIFERQVLQQAHRHVIKKAIAEFSHERILTPTLISNESSLSHFKLSTEHAGIEYHFNAQLMPLEHWLVDSQSITRYENGEAKSLDAVEFIIEFNHLLQIPQDKLGTYLEEIASTINSLAHRLAQKRLPCEQLAKADIQTLEASMLEGHPCFVANNGRIGFSNRDYLAFAPEMAAPVSFIWLGVHQSRAIFSHGQHLSYEKLLEQELDPSLREEFVQAFASRKLNAADYYLIPVHPWQWQNKIQTIFATDISENFIVYLGEGHEVYQAQQSIRTFFNRSNPSRSYVKTALSILNMGFVRGLSAQYMAVTPAINDWVHQRVTQDSFLQKCGFKVLREQAAVGYINPNFSSERLGNTPYNKMLSALWRESPVPLTNYSLMTMAGILHVEPNGEALVKQLIQQSGLSAKCWLNQYLSVYLLPIIHCFYQHQLVFMPHGENLILELDKGIPVGAFVKDIGEEVCLLNAEYEVPKEIQRIKIEVKDEIAVLSIFTDVFDDFFRFLAAIFAEQSLLTQDEFWQQVAVVILNYQKQHPELTPRFNQWDLFCDEFLHSCLNRLQLKNNFQMVDLTNPAGALQFSGFLKNPIAKFRTTMGANHNV